MRFFQGGPGRGGRSEWPPPSPRSRYVANLAAETDDYTISVRQVMCDNKNLYPGSYFSNRFMGRYERPQKQEKMLISMQILAHSPSALARLPEFPPQITAIEESGKRLESLDPGSPVHFENGVARGYTFLAPTGSAHALKSVEGEIQVSSLSPAEVHSASNSSAAAPPSQPAHIAFRIENVPLPRAHLIYGQADAVLVNAGTARHLAAAPHSETIASVRCLRSKSALSLDASMPPNVPALAPLRVPNTLILQQSLSNTFLVPRTRYNPNQKLYSAKKRKVDKRGGFKIAVSNKDKTNDTAAPLRVTVTAGIEKNGEIPLNLTFSDQESKQQSLQIQVSAWDDEPLLLLIPPPGAASAAASQKHTAVGRTTKRTDRRNSQQLWTALRLHLNFDVPEEQAPLPGSRVNPFTAAAGQRGGELAGSIAIAGEPLRSGSIKLKITPLGTKAKPAVIVALTLDTDGVWSLPNTAPGRYQIALEEATPHINPLYPSGTWESYLERRFRIAHPRWQTPPQTELEIAPGGHFTVKPWRVIDSPTGIQGL